MALNPSEALQQAHTEFSTRVEQITDAQWDESSICEGWTVGDLVDHVVGGNQFSTSLLDGGTVETGFEAAINAAVAGQADRKQAYASTMADLLAKLDEPGALERTCHHIVGDISGEETRGLRVVDVSLHAWDLARSIGADDALDPGLVDVLWASVQVIAASEEAKGLFGDGPSGDVGEESAIIDRLLDMTGRKS